MPGANKKTFDRREVHRTVGLCSPCHRHVYVAIPNKELEREYNTLEALKDHLDVERFVEWVKGKPHGAATSARTLAPASTKPVDGTASHGPV